MTTDIASLGLDIDTRKLKQGTRDIDAFQKKMGEIENAATRVERKFGEMGKAAVGFGLTLGAAFSVQKIIEYGDAWQRASNQLRLATEGADELRAAQEGVFAISQKTFSSIDATAQLTSKINQYVGNLTGGLEGTLQLVETINKASALGGTAAASQAAGLFQLNQALASGVLRGEELNSVMEQTPVVARAIADGLGLTIGQLRKVAAQGKITSEIVVKAMQNQAGAISEAFDSIQPTVEMSLTKLQGSITRLVGTAGAPVFEGLASGISSLADALASSSALETVSAGVEALVGAFSTLAQVLPAVAAGLTAMFVVKQLAPVFVALELAMAGAAGRSLVLDRGLQLAATGMASARAAATGLVTALGGPLAVALGLAAGAFVLFADDAEKQSKRALQGVADSVSQARALYAQLEDKNAEVRNAAAAGIKDQLRTAAKQYADSIIELQRLQAQLSAETAQKDLLRGNAAGGGEFVAAPNIAATTAAIAKQAAEVEGLRKNWAGLREEQNSRIVLDDPEKAKAAIDPYGLLEGGASKEAERKLKAFVKAYVDAIKDLMKAQADRNAMLADADSFIALSEGAIAAGITQQKLDQQLDILSETSQLLNGPMAAAYKFMGDAGKDLAKTDAERLSLARRITDAARAQLKIQTDLNRLPKLAAALAVSPEEYQLTQLTFDLLDDGVALTEEAARAEAGKLRAIQRTTDELEKQAARARELAEAPAQNWLDGLTRMSDDFWTDWVNKGFGAFDDLGDAFKNLWKQLQADILRKAFDPMLQQIRGAFGAIGGAGQTIVLPGIGGAGGAGAGGVGGIGGIGGGAGAGVGGAGAGGFGGIGGFNLGNLSSLLPALVASQGSMGVGSIGLLNTGGIFGSGIANSLGTMLGQSVATNLGNLIDDVFNPATAMGGMLGSGLASILGLTGKNASIGGTLGGIAGSFFGGPIGSAIGSFLGQAVGSLIGPQESDHGAVAALDGSGKIIGMTGGKRTAETEGAVRDAASAISEGQALIEKLGATLGATVDQLVLGTRDPSRFSLTGSAALISSGTTGDPQALVNAALSAVLKGASFNSPVIQQVADAMNTAGRSFEDTLKVLGDLADILPATEEPLSQWGEALKQLNKTFQDLRETTQGVASAALDAAEAQAKAALRDDFNTSISDALMEMREPLKKQFGDLLQSQLERVADATRLGGNMADVLALNSEELTKFIEGASGSADVFSDLNEQFAALRAEAVGLGTDVASLDAAFAKAREQIVSSFDKGVSDELDRLSNPTLATLKQLLDGQKTRLDQARALGANIQAVERLNALETQRFFEGLSDDQFKALGNYLGIVEDFTGRIGATLVKLRTEIDDQIDSFDQRRDDLQKQESAWRSGGQALVDLRTELLDRFSQLSPQASLEQLRQRFGQLTEDARGGNQSAITALPQVAQQLVDRSRELFGSTTNFFNDLEGVTRVLDEIGQAGLGRADDITTQLETLEQQRDVLIEIRDLLGQADPQEDFLSDALDRLDAGNVEVTSLLRQYLELSALATGQRLPNGQIAGAAVSAATAALAGTATAPAAGSYAPPPISGAVVASASTSSPSPSSPATSAGSTNDSMAAEAIVELISVTRQTGIQNSRDLANLRNEIRRLAEQNAA